MSKRDTNRYPKLRTVDASAVIQDNHPAILLRDPLRLSGNYMVLPQELGPALMLMDGTHDLDDLRASLLIGYGLPVAPDLLAHLVNVLDENYLLENERSAAGL